MTKQEWLVKEDPTMWSTTIQNEINNAAVIRIAKNYKAADGSPLNCMMIETVVTEFKKGRLFGEIALINSGNSQKRTLSAKTLTDCILVEIDKEVFDIILKEKLRRERDDLGRFIYKSLPCLSHYYTLDGVL
jgi:hypothetical protein